MQRDRGAGGGREIARKRVQNCMFLAFWRCLQLHARAQLHVTCLLPCFAAARACTSQLHVTCLLPCFAAVRAGTIACYLPFAVFCSCTRGHNCMLLAFCRVLQLYARAQLHIACLLPCFAAVRACCVALYLSFAVVCGCPLVPCCIMVAFRHYLLYTYGHAVLHSSCLIWRVL